MGKLAFIFSGQGAQYVGMGSEIAKEYGISSEIFDRATKALGFNIRDMIFRGDEDALKITENTQPAVLTTSIACLQPLLKEGIKPDVVAGLSLGEYTAHVMSGTMTFEDAVRLVKKRGKFMQEAVPVGTGGMAAIIGLSNKEAIECCNLASDEGIIEPANFNCPGQVVVAGEIKAVEKAVIIANEKGAKKAMVLPVSAPFHCKMLKPAGEKLAKEIDKIQLHTMKLPVVANVNGNYVTEKSEVKDLLIKQVSNSVKWEKCVRNMISNGVDTFVEIGPGRTLSGFLRRIDRKKKSYNVENLKSLSKTLEAIN